MSYPEQESEFQEGHKPSLVALLFQIYREKKTGVLHLMQGTELVRVWFSDGGTQHAEGVQRVFEEVAFANPPGGFTGDLMKDVGQLIALGTPPEEALRAAHEGVIRILVREGLAGSVGWGFQEDAAAPSGTMRLPGSLLKEMLSALQREEKPHLIAERFKDCMAQSLCVDGQLLASDGFPPLVLRLFRMASKGQTLQGVIMGLGGGDPERQKSAWQAVGLLMALGMLKLDVAQTTAVPEDVDLEDLKPSSTETAHESVSSRTRDARESLSSRRQSSTARRRSGSARKSAEPGAGVETEKPKESKPPELDIPDDPDWFYKRAAEVEAMNPLLAIDLDPDVVEEKITPDTVRSAFRKSAAVYHPDRLSHLSKESREAAESVFSAFNELRGRMSTQDDIDQAVRRLHQERTGEREITEFDRERARVMGRKAAGFMRYRKWVPARELLKQAQSLDPENIMLVLWENFCAGILQEIPYAEAAQVIEGLEPEGKTGQAERLYRSGWLWKLAGNEKRALHRFKETVQIDPSNVDAKREVRLLEKRRGESEEKPDSNIPFGRFFRRK